MCVVEGDTDVRVVAEFAGVRVIAPRDSPDPGADRRNEARLDDLLCDWLDNRGDFLFEIANVMSADHHLDGVSIMGIGRLGNQQGDE